MRMWSKEEMGPRFHAGKRAAPILVLDVCTPVCAEINPIERKNVFPMRVKPQVPTEIGAQHRERVFDGRLENGEEKRVVPFPFPDTLCTALHGRHCNRY